MIRCGRLTLPNMNSRLRDIEARAPVVRADVVGTMMETPLIVLVSALAKFSTVVAESEQIAACSG